MKIANTVAPLVTLIVTFVNLASAQEAQIPPVPTAVASGPAAQATQVNEPNGVASRPVELLLNFQDAPIRTVLNYLSERAGLTIVANVPLDGSITAINRQPIGLDRAIALINSVLEERDLVVLRVGKTLKVIALSRAKTSGGPRVTAGHDLDNVEASDEVVTHVLAIQFLDAVALRQNLLSLLPETAVIEANRDGNALIITDTTANIKRVMKIVQALDSRMAAVSEIRIFRLTHAPATSAAQVINSIFQQDRQTNGELPAASARVVAAADERSNAVVVRGPPEVLKIAADVMARLDDSTAGVADVRVLHLRYADALNVAQAINQLFGRTRTSPNSQQNQAVTYRMSAEAE